MRPRAKRTLDFLETIPGVERAAITFSYPGVPTEFPAELTLLEGRAGTEPRIVAEARFIAGGYFDVMRIPLVSGELCRDEPSPGFGSAVVNRRFATTYFPDSEAIGHTLRYPNPQAPPIRILGVVADAREAGIHKDPVPVLYTCGGSAQPNAVFLVRTRTDPAAMAEILRRKFREFEPTRAVYDMAPLEERLDRAFAQNRLRTVLLTSFAGTAVALACVGLYGTLSYFVSLRRREVGLRLALGAVRSRIVRHFLTRGMVVAVAGCVAGIALAASLTRLLAGMLFGVSPWDPLTLSMVVALMLAVTGVASLLPATRAAQVEPMQVLRDE
jgi:hypothetical protein